MWVIFPQIDGLGHSPTAVAIEGLSVSAIFGYPDDLKRKPSMPLFASITEDPHSVFIRVLRKYFHGEPDERTLHLLENVRYKQEFRHDNCETRGLMVLSTALVRHVAPFSRQLTYYKT